MIRLRQIADGLRHRLFFVPAMFVFGGIALSQLLLAVDGVADVAALPEVLRTSDASARSMLTTIAGGLISTVTLLLTLMLVAVQLAGSQLSPRTVRDWTGDRVLQSAIGFVMGTVVYCLMILRRTRALDDGDAITPHLSVLVAVLLAVIALLAVVRAVDHLTDRLRIGSVASRLARETVDLIETGDAPARDRAGRTPGSPTPGPRHEDDGGTAIEARHSGWVQQIDDDALFEALPAGATMYLDVSIGHFVMPHGPLGRVCDGEVEERVAERLRSAVAIGDTRTMQQDIGFGIVQMTDIAVRALSPGINDPNTANDLIVHLGVVLLALWEREAPPTVAERDGKRLVRPVTEHVDYLDSAVEPIRTYGAADPSVAATLRRTLMALRDETIRRGLPGPIEPIERHLRRLAAATAAG